MSTTSEHPQPSAWSFVSSFDSFDSFNVLCLIYASTGNLGEGQPRWAVHVVERESFCVIRGPIGSQASVVQNVPSPACLLLPLSIRTCLLTLLLIVLRLFYFHQSHLLGIVFGNISFGSPLLSLHMASLGGVALSALTARNENSLANFVFDFSLVKLEAPTEFLGLGNSLSLWRRTAAENGAAHRTARKLGALFEQTATIPDSLYAAYGLRVSEISASEVINPQDRHRYGLFESHAGADATTIWAAATAGKSAMAVNLLACMLARLWSAPQATSIWYELVEQRKKRILAECDGTESAHILQFMAAEQEITRKELAEWDSSSRAWISLADRVKKSEHQDLEAILQNLSLPVDTSSDTYTSVIRAWDIAMSTVDSLIRGMPHSVNGAVLVAISAWHIYPDIDLFGNHNKSFTFNDKLVQRGGCLTIGLEDKSPEIASGVHWSLSLARLRYYGPPMALTASSVAESKVTFNEFAFVIFGSLLGPWTGNSFNPNFDIREAAQLIVTIWEMLDEAATFNDSCREFMLLRGNWMRILVSAALTLADKESKDWHRAKRLAFIGIRRGSSVLPASQEMPPFFGLLNPSTLTTLLRDSDSVSVRFLRDLAKSRKLKGHETVIAYKSQDTGFLEFATAVASDRKSTKRSKDGRHWTSNGHTRWIRSFEESNVSCDCESEYEVEVEITDRDSKGDAILIDGTRKEKTKKVKARQRRKAMRHKKESMACPISVRFRNIEQQLERRKSIELNGEVCLDYDPNDIDLQDQDQLMSWFNPPTSIAGGEPAANNCDATSMRNPGVDVQPIPDLPQESDTSGPQVDLDWEQTLLELDRWTDHRTRQFRCLVGSLKEAALLVREEDHDGDDVALDFAHLSLPEIQSVVLTGALDADKFLNHLVQLLSNSGSERHGNQPEPLNFLRAFKILGSASQIYKLLPGAQVALRLLERDLSKMGWARKLSSLDGKTVSGVFSHFKFNRSQALACLATFEIDIEESELQNVFAVSVGNSIYAPMSLFSDPYEVCEELELMRIVGNVGKPGLTMMIPPSHPQIIRPEYDRWQVINHEPFDSTCQDYFGKTSLHLSFSGYEQPLASAVKHGAQDAEAQYLETLVSVYEGKRWVADLDILTALNSPRVKRLGMPDNCDHDKKAFTTPRWISVDCWDELIDMVQEVSIVRAHGNFLARLSAVTVAIQIGHTRCLVLPVGAECYECVESALNNEVKGVDDGMSHPSQERKDNIAILIC